MSDAVSSLAGLAFRPLVLAAAGASLLLAAAVALWAHYGTTVFYEMIASGFAACL
jgi:hypothetical protein